MKIGSIGVACWLRLCCRFDGFPRPTSVCSRSFAALRKRTVRGYAELLPEHGCPRIVALGGGTGLPAVLEGLANAAAARGGREFGAVTGIVTVTDDGGSSGRLREQFGVLPPGDARNCLLALTAGDSRFKDLLQHRLDEGPGVVGHPVGNLLLTALTQRTGDFSQAIEQLGAMIGSRGRVLPATLENVRLRAVLESGETINGETRIVRHPSPIRRLSLEPRPKAHPQVLSALVSADGIVVGPGSLYTSVLPNLLVDGVASTMRSAARFGSTSRT